MNDFMTNNEELKFDPLLVDIHPNGSLLTHEESVAMWMNLKDVSEETYQLLVSPLVADALLRMQRTLQLTDDTITRIASAIRLVYFEKITIQQFPSVLKEDIGLSQDKIEVTMHFIRTEVLSLKVPKKADENTEDAPKITVIQLALLDALAQFPRINDQNITGNRIKIKSEKEAVRGSVRNWLRAYRDVLGARNHSALERGQFLFHTENTKNLSVQEQGKLALLFKSLDEHEPLSINPDKQEIHFPVIAATSPKTSDQSQRPISQQPAAQVSLSQKAVLPQPVVAKKESLIQPSQVTAQVRLSQPQFKPQSFNFSKATPTKIIPDHKAPFTKPVSAEKYSLPPITSPYLAPKQPVTDADKQKTPPVTTPSGILPRATTDQFQFSSGHTLPTEKRASPEKSDRIKASLPKSSFGLGYSRHAQPTTPASKKEVWEIPAGLQNVVDLRENK